ncbi:hypothetical protein EBB59_00160 [Lysobacter pythonis]|uniref:Methyltransferase domain-containing protein n=1 Tax=Solilutibacter pythonis TaxID=2483112 RepID=A0A3M2I349_9GAMM|nr:hypothetical protein EBB59_00160 [Lysobacter pythonis]
MRCGAALPLASESVGTVVVQHVGRPSGALDWLAESARVLVPGGRLWLFALNPLSPYRRHWFSADAAGHEPVSWRRALRRAGLHADAVARGLGPRWRAEADAASQQGAGARAAYGLYAEKRHIPLTMQRAPLLVPALGEAT